MGGKDKMNVMFLLLIVSWEYNKQAKEKYYDKIRKTDINKLGHMHSSFKPTLYTLWPYYY